MPTLYVIEPGSRLEKEYDRLLVTKHDELLMRVPIQRVTQVVLVGRVGTTTPALHALLEAGVPLLIVNRSGKLKGRLLPPTAFNLPLRQEQYRRNDQPGFCVGMARAVVIGKIANQRTFALRLARRRPNRIEAAGLDKLEQMLQQAQLADNLASLLGIEGYAARTYFHIYRQAFAAEYRFKKRTRRPPKDPVNALLSLGYSFLTQTVMTALEAVGLDPYLGYFHAEKYGRPALALDLVEEFRTPVIDSLTLSLLNHRLIQVKDFQFTSKGVFLNTHGWRIFLRKYSERLDAPFKSRELGRKITYRKLFEVQTRRMARLIQGKDDDYRPFRLR